MAEGTLTLDERVRPSPVLTAGGGPRGTALEAEQTACFNVLFIYGCTSLYLLKRRGYSPAVVHEPLIAEASPVMEHRFLGIQTR